jgi:DNA invertase Pin-like site-specific DNA recombinase
MNNNEAILKKINWFSYTRCSHHSQDTSTEGQVLKTEQLCKSNNWKLDDRKFEDFGVSAKYGKNLLEGQLGELFDHIENGKIQTPCGIIIESLSRFSRQHPKKVADNFERFVKMDVIIHTLQDNNTYSREDFEGGNIFPLLMLLIKAQANYEWIQQHSKNTRRGFENVRNKLLKGEIKGIYKRNVPFHVKIERDEYGEEFYAEDKERADIIRRIYRERLQGIPSSQIAENLNKDGLHKLKKPAVPFSSAWITHKLSSRSSIGYITLSETEQVEQDGKIVEKKKNLTDKNGNQLEVKIYPAVISEQDFYKTRVLMSQKDGRKKITKRTINTFSGLLKCGCCDKGENSRKGQRFFAMGIAPAKTRTGAYFRCLNSVCKRGYFNEYYLQQMTFNFLQSLDISSMFNNSQKSHLKNLQSALDADIAKLEKFKKERDKLQKLFLTMDEDDYFMNQIKDKQVEIKELEVSIEDQRKQIVSETSDEKSFKGDWKKVIELINEKDTSLESRMMLNHLLRAKIEKIECFVSGLPTEKFKINPDSMTYEGECVGNDFPTLIFHFFGGVKYNVTLSKKQEVAICRKFNAKGNLMKPTKVKIPKMPDLRQLNRVLKKGTTKKKSLKNSDRVLTLNERMKLFQEKK